MSELKFGDLVEVSECYRRVRTSRPISSARKQISHNWKVWELEPYAGGKCIFLGMRNLRNGIVEYDSEYTAFDVSESFNVMLVCAGPKYNPVYAPLPS